MKIDTKTFYLLVLSFPLLAMDMHCEREDPEVLFERSQMQLPPVSTIGASTFGCTVNGKNWVAYTYSYNYALRELQVLYDKTYKSIRIQARRVKVTDEDDDIEININNLTKTGTYLLTHNLDTTARGSLSYWPPYWLYSISAYTTDSSNTGSVVIIKLDTIQHIISGTFEGQLVYHHGTSVVPDSVIQIRNGRFDIKY